MKVKVIASEDELLGVCLDGVVRYDDILEVISEDDVSYIFDREYEGKMVEGWRIFKELVEVVE